MSLTFLIQASITSSLEPPIMPAGRVHFPRKLQALWKTARHLRHEQLHWEFFLFGSCDGNTPTRLTCGRPKFQRNDNVHLGGDRLLNINTKTSVVRIVAASLNR